MKVAITLTDIEPAARVNGLLTKAGFETVLVPPVDDLPSVIAREKPDLILMSGGLLDPGNVRVARQQIWNGCPVVGLADVDDPVVHARLREAGFRDVFAKPVAVDAVVDPVKRILHLAREFKSNVLDLPADRYGTLKGWYDGVARSDHHELVFNQRSTPAASGGE